MGSSLNHNNRQWARLRLPWRERLIVEGGLPCPRCGKLILPGEPWDLGHQGTPRALGADDSDLAPEHRSCSRSAGGKLGHQLRAEGRVPAPPLVEVPDRTWTEEETILVAHLGQLFGHRPTADCPNCVAEGKVSR